MPINVAVEEPGARVVRIETEGHIIASNTDVDDITPDRVGVVVRRAPCHANDVEGMPVQMERVLCERSN